MTNLEWLRTLSAPSLANKLHEKPVCQFCVFYRNGCMYTMDEEDDSHCVAGMTKWLNEKHTPTYRVNWCIHRGGHFDIEADSDDEAMQIVQKEKLPEIFNDIKGDISLSIDKTGE